MSPSTPARHSAVEAAEDRCEVPECTESAVRHLARSEVRKAFPTLAEEGRRVPLCRTHYKAYKKATKAERTFQRLDW
jgi:hypothetical protein